MKKFEIINNRWIKKENIDNNRPTVRGTIAIKIDAISRMDTQINSSPNSKTSYHIGFYSDNGISFSFTYEEHELNQYNADLELFEKLLF